MERLLDLWYAIPRDREWWLDQFSALLTGCTTGCFTLVSLYVLTTGLTTLIAFLVTQRAGESFTMGLAWGTGLWMMVATVLGPGLLALYTRLRGL